MSLSLTGNHQVILDTLCSVYWGLISKTGRSSLWRLSVQILFRSVGIFFYLNALVGG